MWSPRVIADNSLTKSLIERLFWSIQVCKFAGKKDSCVLRCFYDQIDTLNVD